MRTIYNLKELRESLQIEEREEDGVYKLRSSIENLKIYEEEGQRYLERNYKRTKVSNKYFPVPDSYILKSLVNQDYWNSIVDQIGALFLNENGGFTIEFKQPHTEVGAVLDVYRTRNNYGSYFLSDANYVGFMKSPYGDYKKRLVIHNSFDKSKRFAIVLGLMRMICSNGAYALKESDNNFVSDKILHLECNSKEIGEGIHNMFQKIPFLMSEADLLGEMKSQILSEKVKTKFYAEVEKYLREREAVAIEKKQEHTNYYMVMLKIIERTLKQASSVLDFVNVIGYFQVKNRYASNVRSLASTLNNKMKTIYCENN